MEVNNPWQQEVGKSETRAVFTSSLLLYHKLDLLKVLICLAQETHTITLKQYTAIQDILQEAGQMIGGWLKSVAH